MDVWQYIAREDIELPSIYFAHQREVVRRDGMLLANTRHVTLLPGEEFETLSVRFRTVGDATLTGAVESEAANCDDIILEVAASRITERGATRGDDKFNEAAMEDRKKEGYF
jgi:sulfate adenylyltransferase subunit 2